MGKFLKKLMSGTLAFSLAFVSCGFDVFAAKVSVAEDRIYITSTKYNLVPGASETVLTTNNESGNDQRIGFVMQIDADALKDGSIKAVATYKDYQYETLGMQTITDQAAAYEKHTNYTETAFGAINASFYNMTNGEPSGLFIMNGKICNDNFAGRGYFAILNDGTAVVREPGTDYSDVKEAVAGAAGLLIKDGKYVECNDEYALVKYSRAAIGVTKDGDVITYVTHGISRPTSCGETFKDVAEAMIALGCETAVMLDGGGSATYASKREGTNKLTVVSNPSDGTPRTVSNALVFVSTLTATGEFDHARIEPNNEYYTPSKTTDTKIQFTATGIDSTGNVAELPDSGLVWKLAEDSIDLGTIDENTGLFTAAVGALGTVNVELYYNDEVVGTSYVNILEPDELYFSATGVSLNFEDRTDLSLIAKAQGVELITKDGDFDWVIKSTLDNVSDETIGHMEGNTFVAGTKKDFALEGTATVSYNKADGTVLTSSIILEIGKMPIVAMDFEDISGLQGKNVVGSWDWGAKASNFNDADATDQVYEFQNYDILYYLQSTTYGSDSQWIQEVYSTSQPWTENEDGTTVTLNYKGETIIGTKEATYGVHGEKWVTFNTANGDGYYYRGFIEGDTWTGGYNAGGGAAASFLGADGYMMYAWHNAANLTNLASGKYKGIGSRIVDSSEGEVRFGKHALKLTYDFENMNPTGTAKNTSIYYRLTNEIVAQGSPTGFGMWLYSPEQMDNFWLWGQISFWNGSSWTSQTIHYKPTGAEKTCQYTGINWDGWMYVEMDLSSVYAAGAVVDAEHPLRFRSGTAPIQVTYIPGGSSDGEGHAIVMGSKTSGHFYVDNMRWVYGTNIDDMNNPEIISTKANDIVLSSEKITTVTSNDIEFTIEFTDPQGENYSGIDTTATQLFLDGKPLSGTDYVASTDKAQINKMKLANGEHTLKVSICDNFGNKTEKTYRFVVSNPNSEIPTVIISRNETVELGNNFIIKVETDHLSDIATVTTNVSYQNIQLYETSKALGNGFFDDYGNLLTQGPDGKYYDANGVLVEEPLRGPLTVYVSPATQTLGTNLTGKIRNKATQTTRTFTATATVNSELTNDNTLLTFDMPIPKTLTENDKYNYSVTVTYTTKDGNTYTVTSGDVSASVSAYYEIVPDIQISGYEDGKLVINALNGEEVDTTHLQVLVGGTPIEGTFDGNVFTTNYFVNLPEKTVLKNVTVADNVNKHYSFNTMVNVDAVASLKEDLHYDLTLNATTGDSATTENISWFANSTAINKAIISYLTKADYETAYNTAYEEALAKVEGNAELVDTNAIIDSIFENATQVEGVSKITRFGSDLVAVYVNNVKLTGLNAATTYVYRAGDGTNWSSVAEFTTLEDDGTTKFAVVADAQLLGNYSEEDLAAIEVLNKIGQNTTDIDFGIQTGDFVDGGITYYQWDQILDVWGQSFVGKDFVHVIGNHETYGTSGSSVSTAILGLDKSERDYYSVEYGEVYVAVINQTADLVEAAEWLVEDAATTDCTWKVLTCHQPIYFTNPNGSSDGHHKQLKVACDKAGIDFTFSGHDHAFARTHQMLNGEVVDYELDTTKNSYVDEDGNVVNTQGLGTVYYICGDLGEKSRESGYKIVNNPDFNFANASQDYDALYLTVEANENKLTVNVWNITENGTELFDTFTMYTAKGVCSEEGTHVIPMDEAVYNPETKKLICERCHSEIDPLDEKYTGFAVNINGADEYGDSMYYFLAGAVRTEFFTVGETVWYANEDGLIDHATENWDTNTCTESGKRMAYSPRYDKTFTSSGKVKFTGHDYEETEDGERKCKTCGHVAIDVAGWEYSLPYSAVTYKGKTQSYTIYVVNPETGESLEYHGDGTGKLTDIKRTWFNNKDVGTATVVVTINPVGDYMNSQGDVTLELEIRPEKPTNLTLLNVTDTTASLSWDSVEQATGYKVYKLNESGKWNLIGTTTDTSINLDNLNSGSEYTFAVRSYTEKDGKEYNSIHLSDPVSTNTTPGTSIDKFDVTLAYNIMTYTGTKRYPKVYVKDTEGNTLVKDTHYEVIYEDNINVGTATVKVVGLGVYEGTNIRTFEITPRSIADAKVNVDDSNLVYTGTAKKPTITITDSKGNVLSKNDYTVKYFNNVKAGTASFVVTGIGNYKDSVSGEFTIKKQNINNLTIKLGYTSTTYNGHNKTPKVTLTTAKGTVLTKDLSYTVSYKNNNEIGKATVVVKGAGNYTGTVELTFNILGDLGNASAKLSYSKLTYTGKAKKPAAIVIDELGNTLVKGVDYKVSYKNNIEVGISTVTITGIGNYKGTIEKTFTIVPPVARNLKVDKTTASTIKISFDMNDVADKYFIYVNGKYVATAIKYDYCTIKQLESNTTYKITVKAVKVVDGVNVFSINNPTITATTK